MIDLCGIWDICTRMDKHEGQAAWFQGAFSGAAILAAIWIDQGAARRAREERTQNAKARYDAKRQVVQNCVGAVNRSLASVDALDLTNPLVLSSRPLAGLGVAQRGLDFACVPGDGTDPLLVETILRSSSIMSNLQERLTLLGPITTASTRDLVRQSLSGAKDELVQLLKKLDRGEW